MNTGFCCLDVGEKGDANLVVKWALTVRVRLERAAYLEICKFHSVDVRGQARVHGTQDYEVIGRVSQCISFITERL